MDASNFPEADWSVMLLLTDATTGHRETFLLSLVKLPRAGGVVSLKERRRPARRVTKESELPLIQVDLARSISDDLHEQLSTELPAAQVEALGVTPDDLFSVVENGFEDGYAGR